VRWLCTACQVEWSSTGEDHGPCWNGSLMDPPEPHLEFIKETFEVPVWAQGYTHLQAWYRELQAS
jgi:hypothetical protein